jgi:hypothetical protein
VRIHPGRTTGIEGLSHDPAVTESFISRGEPPTRDSDSDGRRVMVSCPHPDETFPVNTLNRLIADEACWTAADLCGLGLLT